MRPEDTGARWRTIERVSARNARWSAFWGISFLVTSGVMLLLLAAVLPSWVASQWIAWTAAVLCPLLVLGEYLDRRRRTSPAEKP